MILAGVSARGPRDGMTRNGVLAAPAGLRRRGLERRLVRDAFGWDTVTWSQALDLWTANTNTGPGGRALEIGAGGQNGGLSLWLAAHGYDVVCSSATEHTPRLRELHRSYGVEELVTYARMDVVEDVCEEQFDLVVVKSVLGAVGSAGRTALRRRAVERIHGALKPGGELWFVENATATRLHELARSRFGAGRWDWAYLSLPELPGLLETFAWARWTTFGSSAAVGRTEWQRRALGHLDRAVLDRVVPSPWHYAVAGIARKQGSS